MPGYGYPEITMSLLCSLNDFKAGELFLSVVKFARLAVLFFFPSQVKQRVKIQL